MKIEQIKIQLEEQPAIAIYYSKLDIGKTIYDPIQEIIDLGIDCKITDEFLIIYIWEKHSQELKDLIDNLQSYIDDVPFKPVKIEFISGTFHPLV